MQTVVSMLRLLILGACAMVTLAFATADKTKIDIGTEGVSECPCGPGKSTWIGSSRYMNTLAFFSPTEMEANIMYDYEQCFAGLFKLPDGTACSDSDRMDAPHKDKCEAEFKEWSSLLCGQPKEGPPKMGCFFEHFRNSPSREYRGLEGDPAQWDWVTEKAICTAGNIVAGSYILPPSDLTALELERYESSPSSYAVCPAELTEFPLPSSYEYFECGGEVTGCPPSSKAACDEIKRRIGITGHDKFKKKQNWRGKTTFDLAAPTTLGLAGTRNDVHRACNEDFKQKTEKKKKTDCNDLWTLEKVTLDPTEAAACPDYYRPHFCRTPDALGPGGHLGARDGECPINDQDPLIGALITMQDCPDAFTKRQLKNIQPIIDTLPFS